MKKASIFFFTIMTLVLTVNAQNERSPYRRGYLRLGISTLGKELENQLSPIQNVLNGGYGADIGYVFEVGHVFYFRDRNSDLKLNFGLDWTIFSGSYHQQNKWEDYGAAANVTDYFVGGEKMSLAASSKIGPVVSWNPVEKLVVDARVQIGYMARVSSLYYSDPIGEPDNRFVSYGDSPGAEDGLAKGFITSFGLTVRRKAIGLSLDYISGKLETPYRGAEAGDAFTVESEEKISTNGLQLKLSFTF